MADTPDLGKLWKQLTDTVGNGVNDVFTKLKDSSIGEQVQSWIGKGENKPVTADQLTQALGPDHMDKIAQQTGKTPQQAAQTMADKLPGMVDKLTPDGHLPDPQTIQANMTHLRKPATDRATATRTPAAAGAGAKAGAGARAGARAGAGAGANSPTGAAAGQRQSTRATAGTAQPPRSPAGTARQPRQTATDPTQRTTQSTPRPQSL